MYECKVHFLNTYFYDIHLCVFYFFVLRLKKNTNNDIFTSEVEGPQNNVLILQKGMLIKNVKNVTCVQI